MSFETYEPEERAKRDEDKDCDVRAIRDCYTDGLISKDEARAMLGFRDDEADDKPADDKPEADRDEDMGDEDEGEDE